MALAGQPEVGNGQRVVKPLRAMGATILVDETKVGGGRNDQTIQWNCKGKEEGRERR